MAAEAAKEVIGPDALALYDKTNGAEDMSCYMEKAPGALAFLGVGCEACGAVWVGRCLQVAMEHNAR